MSLEIVAALLYSRNLRVNLRLSRTRHDAAPRFELIENTTGVRHAFYIEGGRLRCCLCRQRQAQKKSQGQPLCPILCIVADSLHMITLLHFYSFPVPFPMMGNTHRSRDRTRYLTFHSRRENRISYPLDSTRAPGRPGRADSAKSRKKLPAAPCGEENLPWFPAISETPGYCLPMTLTMRFITFP